MARGSVSKIGTWAIIKKRYVYDYKLRSIGHLLERFQTKSLVNGFWTSAIVSDQDHPRPQKASRDSRDSDGTVTHERLIVGPAILRGNHDALLTSIKTGYRSLVREVREAKRT